MKGLLVLFVCYCSVSVAQIDSAVNVPLVSIHIGGDLPGGNLHQRFGPDLCAGGAFLFKAKSNWLCGMESSYFFGRNVKEDVLSQMRSENGNIIDNEGRPADLRVTERGLYVHLVFGRVFKLWSSNPNSGLMVYAGAGAMQHKINLYDAQQKIAAVKGDLKHGYDRLSAGFSMSQFVGYLFLSENRLTNFYFGFEAVEGFTQSLRKINYDTGLPDTQKRFDMLYGLRVGWILPLYKRKPYDYYYY